MTEASHTFFFADLALLYGALRGVPAEGVAEYLPWTLSLRSRVTKGQGCSEGKAFPSFFI